MRILLIALFTFSCSLLAVQAQQPSLDSLYSVWQNETKPDSARVEAYRIFIYDGFLFSNPDTAFVLAEALHGYAKNYSYPMASAHGFRVQGATKAIQGNYPRALEYNEKSLLIYKEIGNKVGMASLLNNIGGNYYSQGVYPKALEYYQRSLKFFEEIGDKKKSALIITNIGLIYNDQKDYPKALEYYQRSLKITKEIDDKRGNATTIMWIGTIYKQLGNYSKALDYLQRSLPIWEEIGNKQGGAWSYSNIGNVYMGQGDEAKALRYFQSSLKIYEEIGDKKSSASVITNIGSCYLKQEKYAKALENCKKALLMSHEYVLLGVVEKSSCQCLYETYKAMGKGNEALVYMEKMRAIEDSMNTEETTKKLQLMEFQKQVLADSIATVEEKRLTEEAHQEEVRKKNQTKNMLLGGGLILIILAGGLILRVRYIRKSKAELQKEKDQSENLLLNILPADIAKELKEKGKADARDFDLVSIIFTDFKSFTQASEKLTAAELVKEINTCFEAFDAIMEKYGVEKIKTIGDAYMAAGGLPVPTDNAVKNTVLAALDMQAFIVDRSEKLEAQGLPNFEMRCGIHTGPVVAGIVGVKKFQYDIWGDTVNTASRMESAGEVGKVNISQATYLLLKDDPNFIFESRGMMEAKGKGEMEMWFAQLKNN